MSKLTRKKAKELSLLKWYWLRDNLYNVRYDGYFQEEEEYLNFWKNNLPIELEEKLKRFPAGCALCGFYRANCSRCPLNINNMACDNDRSLFIRYDNAKTKRTRKKIAQQIIDIIEAWEV